MQMPQLSVIVPVYNEEEGLPALFARLYPALDAGVPYEIIFVNDGSRDRSAALLREQFQRGPTSPASSCSTATSASTWRSWRASSTCAASAS